MDCPLCKGEIAEGAKVCKQCKVRITRCPNCLEYTDGNKSKCQICDSVLELVSSQLDPIKITPTLNKDEAKIYLLKKQKSFGVALLLNFLWAGWGIFYCEAKEGVG